MMDYVEQYDSYDCTVRIYPDYDAPNPRVDYDHLCTMVCWHSRYELGDPDGIDKVQNDLGALCPYDADPVELYNAVIEADFYVLPLYLYDHSGITMNTSGFACPWDSGMVGFIYLTQAEADENDMTEQHAQAMMRGEVEEYDMFLTGQVYGYVVRHKKDSMAEESCWGFFGEEIVKEEADSLAQWMSNQYLDDWRESVAKTASW
jgi:hypothetical protein